MYEKYLLKIEEAGKIRNLKERSISCYKNYVSHFLNYVGKPPENLTCQDVRVFLLTKKDSGIKATTLNLYNSAIRFFYRNVLHILWDDIVVPRMIQDHQLPKVLTLDEIERLLDATDDIKYKAMPHLMENGVEQRNIQALLGHRDPKSTEVYLHVSNKSLMGIQSPFDRKDDESHE